MQHTRLSGLSERLLREMGLTLEHASSGNVLDLIDFEVASEGVVSYVCPDNITAHLCSCAAASVGIPVLGPNMVTNSL